MKYNLTSYQSDNKENPGFFASQPLRGAARSRQEDYLILQILPAQNTSFWQKELSNLCRDATVAYYQCSGSVTSALRTAIESVNKTLRVQNSGLRLDQSPETAAMMVAVLRDGAVYLAQAACASTLLVSGAGNTLFFDESIDQRGIGLSDLLDLRFFKTDVFGADYLLIGAPQTLQAFMSEIPAPNSVIRLVNETTNLPGAFSLTKIGLGGGKVENRLLSLAMILDEGEIESIASEVPEAEVLAQETQAEGTFEGLETEAENQLIHQGMDEPELSHEDFVPTKDMPGQLELPIYEEASFDDEAPSDQTEFFANEDLPEEIAEQPEEDKMVDEVEIVQEAQYAEDPVIIDILPDPDLLENADESISGQDAVVEVVEEYEIEDTVLDQELSYAYAESRTQAEEDFIEDRYSEAQYPAEEFRESEFRKSPEPDLAAIARQERLEKFKKNALTGVARGAGWLRKLEEGAQITARRAERKASGTGKELPSLSPFAKWAIVIIVPLLVVAIAVSIYFSRGLDRQYVYFVNQAYAQMRKANDSATQGEQFEALVQAVVWLDQASAFNNGDTKEIINLRNEAQSQLDKMGNVRRLALNKAFGKVVYPDLNISHLVSRENAVFALDKNRGNILRFHFAAGSYLLDSQFACGPATYGDVELGAIIDMTDVQGANPNFAALLGIDAKGNLIYCSDSGQDQIVVSLTPPEGGFGSIDAIHYGNDGLYVMDLSQNKIWVYRGLAESFPYEPDLYLDSSDADLTGAIDLLVRREGLIVLFEDGKMVFSNVPAFNGFTEAQPPSSPWQMGQGNFSQVFGLQVADNVLYFLEPSEPAIARYSYRLVPSDMLKVSFGDQDPPAQDATAMTVSSSQRIFIAFGSELYYAELP